MKSLLKNHFIPFTIGLFLCSLFLFLLPNLVEIETEKELKRIEGSKNSIRGLLANLNEKEEIELELVGSLIEKNGITLFGSSELANESSYIPYYFLPDSLGIRVNAFGHAFHQSYSMYCELLALKDYLKDSKICIILSPGWFEESGTNIESFLEFVKPNFLQRIITDQSISKNEKIQIGKYLYDNLDLIKNPDSKINYLVNLYKYNNLPVLNSYLYKKNKEFKSIQYRLTSSKQLKQNGIQVNWKFVCQKLQNDFVRSIKSNNQFIEDAYFNSFLKTNDGTVKYSEFEEIDENNPELADFKLLVDLLKKYKAKPSFIIQDLNPYHYKYLNRFNPTLNIIIAELKKNNIPYLNMFTPDKKNYTPGTLTDKMHTGNLGWMKMNKFIVDTYYAEK